MTLTAYGAPHFWIALFVFPLFAAQTISFFELGQPSTEELVEIQIQLVPLRLVREGNCHATIRVTAAAQSIHPVTFTSAEMTIEALSGAGLADKIMDKPASAEMSVTIAGRAPIDTFMESSVQPKATLFSYTPIVFDLRLEHLMVTVDFELNEIAGVSTHRRGHKLKLFDNCANGEK
jgi:hypothetical protein